MPSSSNVFFVLKPAVGNWSRSEVQWWSESLCDVHAASPAHLILIAASEGTGLQQSGVWPLVHQMRQLNHHFLCWLGPPSGCLEEVWCPSTDFLLGWDITVYSDQFIKHYSLRNIWALAPGAGVRQILYHSPLPHKPPHSVGTLPRSDRCCIAMRPWQQLCCKPEVLKAWSTISPQHLCSYSPILKFLTRITYHE